MGREDKSATDVVNALGALWAEDFDAYASGEIGADQLRCVLCEQKPCQCPPFGSPEYFALVARRHGSERR
jgi:hypothetical protein